LEDQVKAIRGYLAGSLAGTPVAVDATGNWCIG